jgi:hypothetical protein
MLREEKRRQERYAFERQPAGTVFLVCDGLRLPVAGINDISNAGVSLCVDEALAVSSPVNVEYADGRVCIQVNGNVSWCAPADETARTDGRSGNYIVGIELASPMLLLSMFQKY